MAAVASILPTEYSRHEELTIQAQQSHHHHHHHRHHRHQQHYANHNQKENQNVNELNDDEPDEHTVLLSPANTASSSSSDDATISYPQTPTQKISHYPHDGTTINTTRAEAVDEDFEYNVMDDEAIMRSYLDPSPVTATTIINNRKRGSDLTCFQHILKDDGDDNNSNRESTAATATEAAPLSLSSLSLSSSPPPPSPSRSSNATLTTYTPQLDTNKIIDHSSDSRPSHNQEYEQQEHQHQCQIISSENKNCRSGGDNIRSMSSPSESTCSSTVSSYSTVATSAASNKQRVVHDNLSSPDHQQPVTKLSALAVHAAKRSEQHHFEHQKENQHNHKLTSVRPMPTSSSRFKTALQIFRSNSNSNNNNSHNNDHNNNDANNNNALEPEPYHYHHLSQVSVSRNSISPSRASERMLHDKDDKEPTISVAPSKSKSLAGRLKNKFQKKPTSDSKNDSNGGSTSSFTANMSRSASLSSITSSWSRLTQSRSGDYSKQKKQQIKSNKQHRSPQQHLSAVIQRQDNNRESTSSIYHSPARHSMYCTPTPIYTVSDDHKTLYHMQQEQKRVLHTHHHQHHHHHHQQQQQQQQQQHLHSDHYRQQHHGQQYQGLQYHRFKQQQQQHCHPQMVMDPNLSSSISTPPAVTTSPILGDAAKVSMGGSFIASNNMTSSTASGGNNDININCNNTVRFAKVVSVRETYARHEYDRGSDPDAVCTRLTPAMAYFIKEELNTYKLHEMQVHECSRENTHFFF